MNNSFESNFEKMRSLLKDLEENKDNLDQSLKIYQQASEIYKSLNEQIDDYKAKIKVIDSGENE